MTKKTIIWKDKERKKYTEEEITDSHLLNIINFLKRKDLEVACSPPQFQGEMAQYYAEQEWLEYSDRILNAIDFFESITKKRKLTLLKTK